MDGIGIAFITLAVLCALLVLAIGAFCLRRYQLRTALGTFDASIRLPDRGWRMGVCRYTDKHLEWLRLVSLSPRPRHRYLRSSLELTGWREPSEKEKGQIQPGAIIVSLNYEGTDVLLAMKFDVYAGLSSWLEAGPVVGIGTWR
jgi:hypothetical protein